MAEFLFEIGLEEVPARMIAGAQAELSRRVVAMLERERLVVAGPGAEVEVRSFATPRRLAVLVGGVAERQADVAEEMTGPSVKVAYKDGAPTPAAVAFAKKAGVEVGALRTVATAKGEYLQATTVRLGRAAAEVLAAEMPKELLGIYWAKNMSWRGGKPERFVRPVRWLLALLGEAVVPISFAGKAAGNITYGHRVLHGDAPVVVERPGEYEAALEAAYVVADVKARRHRIRKALDRACRTVADARWREDHELVETVTQLTEWPSVVMGGFEPEYLRLPEEVLVTVMRDHQKYFAVELSGVRSQLSVGAGGLLPYFLAVLNTEMAEAGLGVVRHGNERVLRARFNDARFFWEFDQRVTLEERVALLDKVTFQKDLGSYAAKTLRVKTLAGHLAAQVKARSGIVDEVALGIAAELSKVDLTTELVKEFTELQGIVGGLYARAQGVSEAAALAIYDQYRPAGVEDHLPRSTEGRLLAIADKADTISGLFGLGLQPTGFRDPLGLRRAANGIIKILAETKLPLVLGEIALLSSTNTSIGSLTPEGIYERVISFFRERLESYLREEKGQAYDVVTAVLAAGADDVRDAVARAEAVAAVRAQGDSGSGDFVAVSAAFKRMKNILTQAREKGIVIPERVDESLLLEPAETALAERSADLAQSVAQSLATGVKAMRERSDYRGALEAIAGLRPQVDAFFDGVMVMVPEESVRANRLALLRRVLEDFSRIADFSEIVVPG